MCNKWVMAEKKTFRASLISKAVISEALPDFNTAQLIQAEEANYSIYKLFYNNYRNETYYTSCKIDGKMLLIEFIKRDICNVSADEISSCKLGE